MTSAVAIALHLADEPYGFRNPRRIRDDLLPCPCLKRQQMQLARLAPQQSAKEETATGAWNQNVEIERRSKVKQEIISNPSKETKLLMEVALLTDLVRQLADRVRQLEAKQ